MFDWLKSHFFCFLLLMGSRQPMGGMAGIESRVAIITGGATGVGAATALMLAARGWRCVINYSRSASEAESTVRQCVALGTKAFAVCGDVARDEACRATADATVKAFGRIDALINSAGATSGPLLATTRNSFAASIR